MSENWLPIETAPKDGTPVLGYADGDYAVVRWHQLLDSWQLTQTGSWAEDGEWSPIFWRPLPAAPVITDKICFMIIPST